MNHEFTHELGNMMIDISDIIINIDIYNLMSVWISAGADGGPRSRVCARFTLRSAPHRHKRKFSVLEGAWNIFDPRKFWCPKNVDPQQFWPLIFFYFDVVEKTKRAYNCLKWRANCFPLRHVHQKFPLVSMGGWAEDQACADPGERTPSAPAEILLFVLFSQLFNLSLSWTQ